VQPHTFDSKFSAPRAGQSYQRVEPVLAKENMTKKNQLVKGLANQHCSNDKMVMAESGGMRKA
jgi:hypothetical protein